MGRFLENDSHCIEGLLGLPCCSVIDPSPESSSILCPGCDCSGCFCPDLPFPAGFSLLGFLSYVLTAL